MILPKNYGLNKQESGHQIFEKVFPIGFKLIKENLIPGILKLRNKKYENQNDSVLAC